MDKTWSYNYRPLSELCVPDMQFAEIKKQQWWLCNPKKDAVLFFGKNPQCNPDIRVMKMIWERHPLKDETEIMKVPLVFLPHRCEDYC